MQKNFLIPLLQNNSHEKSIFYSILFYAKSQILFEHRYDSASDYKNNQLIVIKFELLGEQYVKINRQGNNISIYNLNHSLTRTISFAGYPPHVGNYIILYFSQLFLDPDTAIEFLYGYNNPNGVPCTRIYKEDGTVVFAADSLFSLDEVAIPQQQYTIYNTSGGTKMILSHYTSDQSYVYSLPGTLTTAINKTSHSFTGAISDAYPNPTANNSRVDYMLPSGINNGEIVFYNEQAPK